MDAETRLKALLEDCRQEAVKQGLPADADFAPTKQDMEWICEQLGRKPTQDEWKATGLGWVGDAHCSA